ncbi:hypothetical protein RQM59_08220 [Flavobacteriaceae bacterium S356]|uniref:Uncharacterized protein n=1 Tax=Asprobacillus argus TaxID=3076534 RepID=A0ABU3LH18_9FLAO|nr:hypothetical protein [Flavobacteriaceae bacterium S356]
MDISTDLLKDYIYDKIADIDDENVLTAIKTLIDHIQASSDDTITEKENFNSYIKVWLKDMN